MHSFLLCALRTFKTVEVMSNTLGEIFERCRYLTWLLAPGEPDASCPSWVLPAVLGRDAYRLRACPAEIKSNERITGIVIYIRVRTVWVTGLFLLFLWMQRLQIAQGG